MMARAFRHLPDAQAWVELATLIACLDGCLAALKILLHGGAVYRLYIPAYFDVSMHMRLILDSVRIILQVSRSAAVNSNASVNG